MRRSGMHANTVCCASVHIQEKIGKKIDRTSVVMSYTLSNIELERRLNGESETLFPRLAKRSIESMVNAVELGTIK